MKTIHILNKIKTIIFLAFIVFLSGTVKAQEPPLTIAGWNFENGLTPNEADPQIQASAFSLTGVNNVLVDLANCENFAYKGENWTTNQNLDTSQYYEFTIAPEPGKRLQILRLVFNMEGSTNGVNKGQVRSNLDNFSAGITPFPANPNINYFDISDDCDEIIIHLNALGNTFNNIAEPVTFRIYAYGAGNAFNRLDIDLVKLIGKIVPGGPLPVELVNFNAQMKRDGVKVNWTTATEINNDYFTVEKSTNGKEFRKIATIKGVGNSTELNEYDYFDNKPVLGVSYYRLKQTDLDGKFSYSPIVAVKYVDNASINVFPNPATEYVNVQVQDIQKGSYNLTIFDLSGKLIKNEDINIDGTNVYQIPLNQLQQGIYYIKIDNGEYALMKKFTKS